MTTENFEHLFKMNKYFIAPMSDWNKLATDVLRRSLQKNLELLSDNFAVASDQLKRFSLIKKPEELMNLQKNCLNENLTLAMENMQKLMNLFMENMEEVAQMANAMREPMMAATKSAMNKAVKKTEETS